MDLTHRVLEGELMDAPDLEASKHHRALRGLERVNRLSGTAAVISHAIVQHFAQRPVTRLRVLDLACGGGDVTFSVRQQLIARGMHVDVEGWDRSLTAVEYAQQRAAALESNSSAHSSLRFVQKEVADLHDSAPFDVVMCTLFLHHLSYEQAVQTLAAMAAAASHLVLVDDLRRTWFGYRLAQLGCQLLSRSPIVHVDGPLSVRAAFTELEISQLSQQAGLPAPRIRRHWPQRFLASWNRAQ